MKIVIFGWNEGFNKVRFNKFLRKEHGHCIGAAKAIVDDILNGIEVHLEVENVALLAGFKLKCKVEKEPLRKEQHR